MAFGLSLVLIAAGAVLAYAVDGSLGGVDIASIGVILMVVGAVGLMVSMVVLASPTRASASTHETVEAPPR